MNHYIIIIMDISTLFKNAEIDEIYLELLFINKITFDMLENMDESELERIGLPKIVSNKIMEEFTKCEYGQRYEYDIENVFLSIEKYDTVSVDKCITIRETINKLKSNGYSSNKIDKYMYALMPDERSYFFSRTPYPVTLSSTKDTLYHKYINLTVLFESAIHHFNMYGRLLDITDSFKEKYDISGLLERVKDLYFEIAVCGNIMEVVGGCTEFKLFLYLISKKTHINAKIIHPDRICISDDYHIHNKIHNIGILSKTKYLSVEQMMRETGHGLCIYRGRILCTPVFHAMLVTGNATDLKKDFPTHDKFRPANVCYFFKGTYTNEFRCYVCSSFFKDIDSDKINKCMCYKCGVFNHIKKMQSVRVFGKTALITGGRIKIGYTVALILLRGGATVHVTTRFLQDTLDRYASEDDYETWKERLNVHKVDFIDNVGVSKFIEKMKNIKFDILINNAALTIKHPDQYYKQLRLMDDPKTQIIIYSDSDKYFPGTLDRFGVHVDLRPNTSWTKKITEIDVDEYVEAQMINCYVPFRLISELKENMNEGCYIVNVTSREGEFSVKIKSTNHVHTNISKSGLNMITKTIADDYAKSKIYVVSVTPGYVSNMHPLCHDIATPLDCMDGAMRILDPVINKGQHGLFYKNYKSCKW